MADGRMFQIHEGDLAELERLLPSLGAALATSQQYSGRVRTQLRRCKAVLSDVRWNYGPPDNVTIVSEPDGTDQVV